MAPDITAPQVSLLLQEGANPVSLDGQGWTPVMYADFDGRKVHLFRDVCIFGAQGWR